MPSDHRIALPTQESSCASSATCSFSGFFGSGVLRNREIHLLIFLLNDLKASLFWLCGSLSISTLSR
jgi:hypothetical protein